MKATAAAALPDGLFGDVIRRVFVWAVVVGV